MHLARRGAKARIAAGLGIGLSGGIVIAATACSLTVSTDDLSSQAGVTGGGDANLADGGASATDGSSGDSAMASGDATMPPLDGPTNGDDDATSDGAAPPDAARTDYVGLVLAANPLAYYRFEDTGVIAKNEVSATLYTGVYQGEFTQGGQGALGSSGGASVRFDGATTNDSGNVVVSNAFAFANNAPFTYELWFRAATVDSSYRTLLDHGSGAGSYLVDWENSSTSQTNVFFSSNPASGTKFIDSQLLFSPGPWNYLVVTFDGTTIALYKNGVAAATQLYDVTGGIDGGGSLDNLYIGSGSSAYNEFYGDVDEFAVYDHALDAMTVEAHYAAAIAQGGGSAGVVDGGSDAN